MHSSIAGHTILYPTRESVQLVNCSLLAHMAQDEEAPEGEDLCALSSGGLRDTGDPGAPLMVDTTQGWALVGLLSWLGDSQTLSTLAVFTDVRSLMPWLLETVFKTF
ncbi:chymotrypsinogen B-like [Ixodes scapularis]|uniref:chymotrypsinogen B-like n=1 Tax=Ixodes scapularis TaxID=6945 RepID=UPI001A9FB541|nr:chymotrypsinogen B-like [Ixodes scapularis]